MSTLARVLKSTSDLLWFRLYPTSRRSGTEKAGIGVVAIVGTGDIAASVRRDAPARAEAAAEHPVKETVCAASRPAQTKSAIAL